MKMKKILFSLLTIFILIVMVACGKKEAPTEDANAQQQGATTEATQDYQFHNQKIISVELRQLQKNMV